MIKTEPHSPSSLSSRLWPRSDVSNGNHNHHHHHQKQHGHGVVSANHPGEHYDYHAKNPARGTRYSRVSHSPSRSRSRSPLARQKRPLFPNKSWVRKPSGATSTEQSSIIGDTAPLLFSGSSHSDSSIASGPNTPPLVAGADGGIPLLNRLAPASNDDSPTLLLRLTDPGSSSLPSSLPGAATATSVSGMSTTATTRPSPKKKHPWIYTGPPHSAPTSNTVAEAEDFADRIIRESEAILKTPFHSPPSAGVEPGGEQVEQEAPMDMVIGHGSDYASSPVKSSPIIVDETPLPSLVPGVVSSAPLSPNHVFDRATSGPHIPQHINEPVTDPLHVTRQVLNDISSAAAASAPISLRTTITQPPNSGSSSSPSSLGLDDVRQILVPVVVQNALRRDPKADLEVVKKSAARLLTDDDCLEFVRLAQETKKQIATKGGRVWPTPTPPLAPPSSSSVIPNTVTGERPSGVATGDLVQEPITKSDPSNEDMRSTGWYGSRKGKEVMRDQVPGRIQGRLSSDLAQQQQSPTVPISSAVPSSAGSMAIPATTATTTMTTVGQSSIKGKEVEGTQDPRRRPSVTVGKPATATPAPPTPTMLVAAEVPSPMALGRDRTDLAASVIGKRKVRESSLERGDGVTPAQRHDKGGDQGGASSGCKFASRWDVDAEKGEEEQQNNVTGPQIHPERAALIATMVPPSRSGDDTPGPTPRANRWDQPPPVATALTTASQPGHSSPPTPVHAPTPGLSVGPSGSSSAQDPRFRHPIAGPPRSPPTFIKNEPLSPSVPPPMWRSRRDWERDGERERDWGRDRGRNYEWERDREGRYGRRRSRSPPPGYPPSYRQHSPPSRYRGSSRGRYESRMDRQRSPPAPRYGRYPDYHQDRDGRGRETDAGRVDRARSPEYLRKFGGPASYPRPGVVTGDQERRSSSEIRQPDSQAGATASAAASPSSLAAKSASLITGGNKKPDIASDTGVSVNEGPVKVPTMMAVTAAATTTATTETETRSMGNGVAPTMPMLANMTSLPSSAPEALRADRDSPHDSGSVLETNIARASPNPAHSAGTLALTQTVATTSTQESAVVSSAKSVGMGEESKKEGKENIAERDDVQTAASGERDDVQASSRLAETDSTNPDVVVPGDLDAGGDAAPQSRSRGGDEQEPEAMFEEGTNGDRGELNEEDDDEEEEEEEAVEQLTIADIQMAAVDNDENSDSGESEIPIKEIIAKQKHVENTTPSQHVTTKTRSTMSASATETTASISKSTRHDDCARSSVTSEDDNDDAIAVDELSALTPSRTSQSPAIGAVIEQENVTPRVTSTNAGGPGTSADAGVATAATASTAIFSTVANANTDMDITPQELDLVSVEARRDNDFPDRERSGGTPTGLVPAFGSATGVYQADVVMVDDGIDNLPRAEVNGVGINRPETSLEPTGSLQQQQQLQPQPPQQTLVPALWGMVQGRGGGRATDYSFDFHVDEEVAAAVKRWSQRELVFNMEAAYVSTFLYCLPASEVARVNETLPAEASREEIVAEITTLDLKWPRAGVMVFDINDGDTEGNHYAWLPYETKPDRPIDISPYVKPGLNTIRVIQLDDIPEHIFVLCADVPTQEERRALDDRVKLKRRFSEFLQN